MKKAGLLIGLLAVFFLLVLTSVRTKSPICDEAAHHIGSGYSYLVTKDFRMNPSAPPLLRLIMAMPLLPLDLKLPLDHPSWQSINSSEFNYQFLFVKNSNAEEIVFLSRLPMIMLSMLFGLAVFLCANRFFGFKAGVFALFLYVFNPAVLANAGLAMLDMGAAFFSFLALYLWFKYLKKKRVINLMLASICLGLALSTKVSALMVLPLMVLLLFVDTFEKKTQRQAGASGPFVLALIGAFFILWATYFFEFKPLLKNAPDVEEKVGYIHNFAQGIPFVDKEKFAQSLVSFAQNVPIPLGEYVISSLGIGRQVALGDQRLFFFGDFTSSGSKIYYLVNYLIKAPLAEIILLIVSLVLVRKRTKLDRLSSVFLIASPLVFFVFASFSKLQGGIRYLLPMYPFLFIWLSDLMNIKLVRHALALKLSFFWLCAWYAASALVAYPNYLSYFNELTGGSRGFGYKISADSDWGQDFKALKMYLDKKGIKEIAMHVFGSVDPHYYGIDYRKFSDDEFTEPREHTYYAISTRYLPEVKWANRLIAKDRVANTIFIYYFKDSKLLHD